MQQPKAPKARYLSCSAGYWVEYNWLCCLFVLFSDYELEELQHLLWIPGINLDEKHPCTCPQTVKRTYHLRDVRGIIVDVVWKLWLGIVGCLQVYSDNVASQKKAYGCCQAIKFVQAWLIKSWNGQSRVFSHWRSQVLAEQAYNCTKDGERFLRMSVLHS